MGVPSSGTLEMIKIARERRWSNYSGNGTITGPISMYNLILGGNTGGAVNSGDTYLTPNPSSPTVLPGGPPPIDTPYRFSNFYGYEQTTTRTAFNYIYDSSSGPNGSCLSGFTQGPYYHTGLNLMPSVGDVVYQGAAPSTTKAAAGYYTPYTTTGFPPVSSNQWFRIIGLNGVVHSTGNC
jgi:hypothetical protein